jgi:hypothetical protein
MEVTIQILGNDYTFTRDDILRIARITRPDRINTFYVEVEGKRFPPTQLIRAATQAPIAYSFNSRSALTRLGFDIKTQNR